MDSSISSLCNDASDCFLSPFWIHLEWVTTGWASHRRTLWCERPTVKTENQRKAKRSLVFPPWGQEQQLPILQSCVFALPCVDRVVIFVLFQGSQERPKLSYNRFLHFSKDILWSFMEKKQQCCCSQLELPLEQHGNVFFMSQPVFTC